MRQFTKFLVIRIIFFHFFLFFFLVHLFRLRLFFPHSFKLFGFFSSLRFLFFCLVRRHFTLYQVNWTYWICSLVSFRFTVEVEQYFRSCLTLLYCITREGNRTKKKIKWKEICRRKVQRRKDVFFSIFLFIKKKCKNVKE